MEACAKKYGQKKMKGICCLNSINIIQKKMSLVQDDRKKMYSHIVHVGILIFIIALCIVNWNKLSIITIVDDEFGYWAAGAQFAGLDWKNLLGESYYYSYGYGLLLIPLYLLRLPAEVMFKAAVIGNIIFLLASFELAVYMGKCLFPRTDKRLLMAAGGVVTLLSGNIFLVHIGAPEILLYFYSGVLRYV